MKHLLISCFFLLFSCKIISQSNFRIMGFSTGLSYNEDNYPKVKNPLSYFIAPSVNLTASYQYNSFHQIRNSPLYFTLGTNLICNGIDDNKLIYGQRLGLAFKTSVTKKRPAFFNFGGEINTLGLGLFSNANLIYKYKNTYFVISPEINYTRITNTRDWKEGIFMASCGVGMGWNKKEFVPKENKKYGVLNHFIVNIGIGNFRKKEMIEEGLKSYSNFLDVNASYRLFSKQIISPEVGIGLMIAKGRIGMDISKEGMGGWVTYGIYSQYTDIIPYMKIGFGIQTRRKIAVISNIDIFSSFNFATLGSHLSVGAKYSINNKIAFSLSPALTYYSGSAYGKYQAFEREGPNSAYQLIKDIKGLHRTSSYGYIYALKLGVHF